MPKFAANLTMLFNEVPFPQRFAAAASAGSRPDSGSSAATAPLARRAGAIAGKRTRGSRPSSPRSRPAGCWAGPHDDYIVL